MKCGRGPPEFRLQRAKGFHFIEAALAFEEVQLECSLLGFS
jgi:hypothetical protein